MLSRIAATLIARARGPLSKFLGRYRIRERPVGSLLEAEELDAVRRVIRSGESLSWGDETASFEEEFRRYTGARNAVATSSCTAALQIAAQVLRLGPDDEVICTPQTFIASVVALLGRSVRIRFADIEADTLNIDPATIESKISPRTKAIYIVHRAGLPVDLQAVRAIASAHGLTVVEDCAHAVGAEVRGQRIGNGDICCFSFSSLKNMTTLGEGGMFCTNNDAWAREARKLRSWGTIGREAPIERLDIGPYEKPGFPLKDHSQESVEDLLTLDEVGSNLRLSTVEAAVGRVQLRKVDGFIAKRTALAQRYHRAIDSFEGLKTIQVPPGRKPTWHLYTCFIDDTERIARNALIGYLQERGIQIIMRYFPLHLHRALRFQGHAFGECPVCERVWFERQIDLPINPAMSDSEIDAVIRALRDGVQQCRR